MDNKQNQNTFPQKTIYIHRDIELNQDEFISLASHELKTPVTSLKIFTQLFSQLVDSKNDPILSSYIKKMNLQIDKLNGLVDNLLDISRINNNSFILNYQKFSLNQTVCSAIQIAKADNCSHHITYIDDQKYDVTGDQKRITAIIVNLLSNAIKYSPQSDKIIISVDKTVNSFTVSIQDFGIGIDKKYQQKIFQKFYRVYNEYSQTFPGLGIGLYLSSEIIKLHGGTILVKSNLGQGSTFSFTIPQPISLNP